MKAKLKLNFSTAHKISMNNDEYIIYILKRNLFLLFSVHEIKIQCIFIVLNLWF